jgi:hypothetical protein
MIPFIVVRFVPFVVEETFAVMICELSAWRRTAQDHEQLQSPFATDLFFYSPERQKYR